VGEGDHVVGHVDRNFPCVWPSGNSALRQLCEHHYGRVLWKPRGDDGRHSGTRWFTSGLDFDRLIQLLKSIDLEVCGVIFLQFVSLLGVHYIILFLFLFHPIIQDWCIPVCLGTV
jgi:hypothetical protein